MSKVVLLLLFAACLAACSFDGMQELIIKTSRGNIPLYVQRAETPEARKKGLMMQTNLPEQNGMLFIFEQEQRVFFTMRQTLIPLDMLFINTQGKILHIEKNVQPCKSEPCQIYSSPSPVLYVVETNGGFSDAHALSEGDTVLLSH